MCRMCGARPAGALRSSLRRWLTPNRCCSSTTATSRRSNSTASSISACVPTRIFSSPDAELAQQVGAARLRRGAGEQRGLDELTRHQLLQRREVLLGERLGGRHQRGLAAGLDGAQHRVQRDDGLAGADLAHQQALHRAVGRHVLVERGHRALLVAGGRERERVAQPAGGELARGAQRLRPRALAAARAAAQERDLQQQELVEREPSPAALLVAEVRGVHGRPAVRQALQRPDAGGQRLEHVAHLRALLVHERGDLHAREPVRGRVGGHVLPRRHELARLGVLVDAEPALALVLAGEQEPGAGAVAALEPRLVEERHAHRARLVAHPRGHERLHATSADLPARDREHLDHHGRGLPLDEVADRARGAPVARDVVQQRRDARQAELRARFLGLLARQLQRVIQPRGPRDARAAALGERVGAGELRSVARLGSVTSGA